MVPLGAAVWVVVLLAFACFGTFSVAYQLGYAHGRLRELDCQDQGPDFREIDEVEAIAPREVA